MRGPLLGPLSSDGFNVYGDRPGFQVRTGIDSGNLELNRTYEESERQRLGLRGRTAQQEFRDAAAIVHGRSVRRQNDLVYSRRTCHRRLAVRAPRRITPEARSAFRSPLHGCLSCKMLISVA